MPGFSPLAFGSSKDIANRAMQHVGARHITSLFPPDASVEAGEVSFLYHKTRMYELRRNLWTFAIRKATLRALDTSTMFLTPAVWSSAKTYSVGGVVSYNGVLYFSQINANTGNTPDTNPTLWTQYFGPLTAELWQGSSANPIPSPGTTQPPGSYYAGELVYYPAVENPPIYLSTTNGNTDTPGGFPLWSATTQYNAGDTIGVQLLSQPGNVPVFSQPGNIPVIGRVWQSLADLNIGIMPGSNPASWQDVTGAVETNEMTGQNWLRIDSTVQFQRIIWPVGCGPRSIAFTRNLFRLPNGWLRDAPENLRRGVPLLGVPQTLPANDFEFDADFIVSSTAGPIIHRFVADISDVSLMDPMFCEGFAAHMGEDLCERLTQDETKKATCGAIYKRVMGEARLVNAVIQSGVEMPLDDYIACRL